jgi:hypothetical protein
MATNLEDLGESVREGIKAFTGRFIKQELKWSRPYLVGLRVKALVEIKGQDWDALKDTAQKYRDDALEELAAIGEHQDHWRTLMADLSRLQDKAGKKWMRPKDHDEWPEIQEKIRKKLKTKGMTNAQIDAGLKKFGTVKVDTAFDVFRAPLRVSAQELETGAQMRLAALAGTDIADAVAQFNDTVISGDVTKPASGAVQSAHTKITAGLRDLQTALRSQSMTRIQTKCDQLERTVEKQLGPIGNAVTYWERVSTASGNVGDARNALKASDAMRLALFAASAARTAKWAAGWGEDSDVLNAWRDAAKMSFASAFKEPAPTPLVKVIGSPSTYNKKVITLEGKVGPVSIKHLGEKVISSASLSDSNGAVVAVGLTHIKIDSGGMVAGSYASLTGTFAASSSEFPGPTLILNRRVLTDDSESSWLDWVQLKLLTIITPVPHGLTGRWSWKAGLDGPGNLLQYGTWAESRRVF